MISDNKSIRKIKVGVNISLVNNISILMNHPEIEIVSNPEATYISGKVVSNFDYYLDIGIVPSDDLSVLLGDRYIEFIRYSKRVQMMILENHGIRTPETVFPVSLDNSIKFDHNVYTGLAESLSAEELVVKGNHGAKGEGQALVNIDNFSKFSNVYLGTLGSPLIDVPEDIAKIGGGDSPTTGTNHTHALNGDNTPIISKRETVIAEYRIIFGHHLDVVVEKRKVSDNGWQSKGGNGEIVHTGDISGLHRIDFPMDPPKDVVADFSKKLTVLIKSIGYPFGSMDVYVTSSGELGVFEFCPQFAHAGIHPGIIRRITSKGILSRLAAHNERKG